MANEVARELRNVLGAQERNEDNENVDGRRRAGLGGREITTVLVPLATIGSFAGGALASGRPS
jgi:hypothetical protein